MNARAALWTCLAALALALPAHAQDDPPPTPAPEFDPSPWLDASADDLAPRLQAQVAAVTSSDTLTADARAALLERLVQTQARLRPAPEASAQADEWARQIAQAPQRLDTVRAQIADPPAFDPLPEDADRYALDALQTQLEDQLEAARELVDDLREEALNRQARLDAITPRQAQLRAEGDALPDQLEALDGETLAGSVARLELAVRALELRRQLEWLRLEAESYQARRELLQARQELAAAEALRLEQRWTQVRERNVARRLADAAAVADVNEIGPEVLTAYLADVDALDAIDASLRQSLVDLHQRAAASLEQAGTWSRQAAESEQDAQQAPARIEAIQAELQRADPRPQVTIPEGSDPAQVQQLQAQLEADAAAARQRLELLNEPLDISTQRTNLAEQLAQSRQQLTETTAELAAPIAPELPYHLALGQRLNRLARRRELRAQIRALEAQIVSLDAQVELRRAQRQQAQLRLDQAQARLNSFERAVADWRRRRAEDAEAAAQRLLEDAARRSQVFQDLAAENSALAAEATGPQGLTARLEDVSRDLTAVRERLRRLREQFQTTRRKVKAAGVTAAMGALLRRHYEAIADVALTSSERAIRDEQISETQFALILHEEKRQALGDMDQTLRRLMREIPEGSRERPEVERLARELLQARRDLLQTLIQDGTLYLNRLIDLERARQVERDAVEEYRRYIEERILWVRSVPGSPPWPTARGAWSAAAWYTHPDDWGQGWARSLSEHWLRWVLSVVWIVAWWFGARFGRWVLETRLTPAARRPWSDQAGTTLRALAYTAGIAARWPWVVWLIGRNLTAPDNQPAQVLQTGWALQSLAAPLFCAELFRQLVRAEGIAEVHFRWSTRGLEVLRKHLRWFVPVFAVTYLATHALDGPGNPVAEDPLGRVVFVLGQLALAVFTARVLWPEGEVLAHHWEEDPSSWVAKLRFLWFGALVVGPLVMGAIALRGYYYTALQLSLRIEWTWVLGLALILTHAVLLRWLWLARLSAKRAQRQAERKSANQSGVVAREESELPADLRQAPDISSMDDQSQALFRSVIAGVVVIGLLAIWGEVLPALRRMRQVEVWPQLRVVEAEDEEVFPNLQEPTEPVVATPAPSEPEPASEEGAEGEPAPEEETPSEAATPTPSLTPTGLPTSTPPSGGGAEAAAPTPLTLADLCLAVVFGLLTFLAGKNLPGFVDLMLWQRLSLDSGLRYAIASLSRYVIVIVGTTLALSFLGLDWSKLQWLAAALTFGLAFGLQEIFANFVSGIILLFERPVRVGDSVTIGDVSGNVARIRIRATTILDWDGKELVIPNKELVTGRVINWTLTDTTMRVVIPITVAYGTHTPKAKRLLLELAHANARVLSNPEPRAFFRGFGNSALELQLRVWVKHPDDWIPVMDELLDAISVTFEREEITIPFPQRDLHLRTGAFVAPAPTPTPEPPLETIQPEPSAPLEVLEKAPDEDAPPPTS